MNKKAFTLIEMIISIIILSLIMSFFIFFISDTKTKISHQKESTISSNEKIKAKELLFKDLAKADELNITSGNRFCKVTFRSFNSLYGIQKPFVAWAVITNQNTLVRYESAYPFYLPITSENKQTIYAEPVMNMCDSFYISNSNDKSETTVYLKKLGDQNPSIVNAIKLNR